MFYSLLKWYGRLAIKIYCHRLRINKPAYLQMEGPLLLASNHPNSFLDGMILTTLFRSPVHSLARGDAFKNKWVDRLLRRIRLLPVYRTSEGVENLGHNYTTFAACRKTFEKGESVLIFSEGRCENEWHLRPLKKGTARLAISSWQNGIPVRVLPVAINYSSFKNFGKEVHLYFGEPITADSIDREATEGKQLLDFNALLHAHFEKWVYEIDDRDKARQKEVFSIRKDDSLYYLWMPAMIGFVLHAPLYYLSKKLTEIRYKNNGHYDSVITGLLLLFYPFYLLLFLLLFYALHPAWSMVMLLLMPFTAWCATRVKYQLGL